VEFQGSCGGKELDTIGADIPNTIQRLMRKSPKTQTLSLNEVDVVNKDDETTLEITNAIHGVERYAKIAEQQGYKKVMNAILRELKKLTKMEKDL
jgi:transglutaminase/protease-like cytokinesis protein 3